MPSSELSGMFCYVYLLRSIPTRSLYVGFTHDLRRRITEHNKAGSKSTKSYVPWELLYYEAHRNEQGARRREKYLKTTTGGSALKRMISEQLRAGEQRDQKVYY